MTNSNIVNFSEAANRQWQEDFKKRWIAKGDAGEFTNDIWAWEEMLKQDGWVVQFFERVLPEFTTFVDFDKKLLTANVPKAYHMKQIMASMLDTLFAGGAQGRWLYQWKEVQDDAHRNVRDGDEWKDDKDYYMTVWYSMELYIRELDVDVDALFTPPCEEVSMVQEAGISTEDQNCVIRP